MTIKNYVTEIDLKIYIHIPATMANSMDPTPPRYIGLVPGMCILIFNSLSQEIIFIDNSLRPLETESPCILKNLLKLEKLLEF